MDGWKPWTPEVGVTAAEDMMVSEEMTSMELGSVLEGVRHAFGGSLVMVIWEKKSRGNAVRGGSTMGIPCDWQLDATVS